VITYKLFEYCFAHDDEEVVFESEDESLVVNEAILLSKENENNKVGYWTYRLERWDDDRMVGGWRFFNNGIEFTDWLRKTLEYNTKGRS
jgi:hypothetical protein